MNFRVRPGLVPQDECCGGFCGIDELQVIRKQWVALPEHKCTASEFSA